MLKNKKILIIITGSIAAYKSLYLIRLLKKNQCDVNCIMTNAAKEFITPLSVSSLSENKVYNELFDLTDELEMGHIKLAKEHDAILVVPATANFISKISSGIADDLGSTLLLCSKIPTFIFPAMNVNMWNNTIIKNNIERIRSSGIYLIEGPQGSLACGDIGYGRLMEPDDIVKHLESYFNRNKPIFKGIKALVTAGPTREPIDPVRYISNHSSGIQGYAIAEELAKLGGDVSLITGPTNLKEPNNIKKIYHINTAEEMYKICKDNIPKDLFISAAAVTDWRSKRPVNSKIKKCNNLTKLELIENPDILKYISFHPKRPKLVVGFAAETNSLRKNAKTKMSKKNCDLLIANDVSSKGKVFGNNMNEVHIINKKGEVAKIDRMHKKTLSQRILKDYIHPLLVK
ncbi:MAG: bifunctional phosphopantothenoylcysteine decarboxylase/phosphopantothenate--cysteine ligase CoaBC [Rickettsiales bacterium]|nr:bifunctional phosphopantothenoylcysteine decarboxylase/phosphopantothenate--cysteine ligase CoaBC [Rickettsiales bacterium]